MKVQHKSDTGLNYDQVTMHARPGIHDDVFIVVHEYLAPQTTILDIGSGSGAFTKRLLDAGYKVTSVDFDSSTWALDNVPLINQNLNLSIWDSINERFDVIVAIELIEHLENISNFLRNIQNILQPNGLLVITMPNILSVESRRKMIFKGNFSFFQRGTLFSTGHMNILPYWLLEEIYIKVKFEIVKRLFIGKQPLIFR